MDYTKEEKVDIIAMWQAESKAANQCICDILESYTEFLLLCMTPNLKDGWETIVQKIALEASQRHSLWHPFYKQCLETLNKD